MKKLLPYFVTLIFLSCDNGLELPPDVEPGIGGTIYFAGGTWPPTTDSLQNLWLFASQIYPVDSSNILTGITSSPPRIYLYPSAGSNLPFFVDSVTYSFPIPPASYRYIGVIQRFRPGSVFDIKSYRIIGILRSPTNPADPKTIVVRDFEFVQGVNVYADFYNLPPQPF